MIFSEVIRKQAYRFRKNRIAIFLFQKLYRIYIKTLEKSRKKAFRLHAVDILKDVKEALEQESVFFWLEYGTLLGAYREHDFISHDCDLDFGVFFEDADQVSIAMKNANFRLLHEFSVEDRSLGFEQTYEKDGVTMDFFFFHKRKEEIYCNGFHVVENDTTNANMFQVKEVIFPYNGFSKYEFKGEDFNIPTNVEEHLAAHYGEDFMTPQVNFNSKKAPNAVYFSIEERVGRFTMVE